MFTRILLIIAIEAHNRLAIFMLISTPHSVISFTIGAPIPFTVFLSSADIDIH